RSNNDIVKYYLSLIPVMQLRPVVLIAYEREAYRGLFDEEARLTLDRNLCCLPGRAYDLFYSGRNWFNVKSFCILELKFNNVMPFFFKRIIERLDLWANSISKYCLCIERIKPLL
ncbi:VTC domain-containing protein, partial [Candidatus Poribacteria bacterium]|nr:VTC domain-containing protein [Candidatus Poribacteria bacterium]